MCSHLRIVAIIDRSYTYGLYKSHYYDGDCKQTYLAEIVIMRKREIKVPSYRNGGYES